MKTFKLVQSLTVAAILGASFTVTASTSANAGSKFTPPGMELCLNPGGCPSPSGGGGFIAPPAPPGPSGGGLGTAVGIGLGLGIVNSLSRPRTVVVQQPNYVQQPAYVQPVQTGLSPQDQYCLMKYKSYNVSTKRYLSYSGVYKICQPPLN